MRRAPALVPLPGTPFRVVARFARLVRPPSSPSRASASPKPGSDLRSVVLGGKGSSIWVRCETAGRPELAPGEPVTLLGARHAPADEGPFREAEALDVALVFAGDRRTLRDALLARSALYLAGAAAAVAGLTLTLARL